MAVSKWHLHHWNPCGMSFEPVLNTTVQTVHNALWSFKKIGGTLQIYFANSFNLRFCFRPARESLGTLFNTSGCVWKCSRRLFSNTIRKQCSQRLFIYYEAALGKVHWHASQEEQYFLMSSRPHCRLKMASTLFIVLPTVKCPHLNEACAVNSYVLQSCHGTTSCSAATPVLKLAVSASFHSVLPSDALTKRYFSVSFSVEVLKLTQVQVQVVDVLIHVEE